ncbi:MAG: peptidoglycan-binding protein [Clostridium sp.]|uniref:peptidoglycan-binding protein n=1 Tax=Clostridium sp. TaxID=1506 RepID=UPI0025C45897|nr:peptidoglycan-binding protein [Clostridium sp.]MCE5219688.1 peptidoglycan-binding protein [Clostridium sp.]
MLLKNGSTGPEVGIIQNNLKMLGYDPLTIDCIFGTKTENAVKNFQSSYGLAADGIVGDNTWSKLINEIKYIQTALNQHGYNLSLDGIAGINTYSSLIDFQKLNNLVVDGIVGSKTKGFLCPSMNYNISPEGIGFIADYESFYAEPYRGLDSQNQTIGYGHVIVSGENFESLTVEEAKDLLKKDLNSFVDSVNTIILGLSLSQNQFDALVSFAYNCGVTALNNSTLLKDIKANSKMEKIKEDFLMWCNCNGERALGLYRRRFDEFKIYESADYTRTYRNF